MNYGFTDEELANLSKWMLYYEIELKKNKKGFGKNRITLSLQSVSGEAGIANKKERKNEV